MPRRNLFIRWAPKLGHGDAARIAELCEQSGLPLVPWQRQFLDQAESASITEQFNEIVRTRLRGRRTRPD